jgi:hypothetical protein
MHFLSFELWHEMDHIQKKILVYLVKLLDYFVVLCRSENIGRRTDSGEGILAFMGREISYRPHKT